MRKLSRRSFLKGGLAAACAMAAAPLPLQASERDPRGQLATLVDIGKCVGCEACVEACAEANAAKFPNPEKPFPRMFPSRVQVEDWSDKQDVTNRLTPYNWLTIQRAEVIHNGKTLELSMPRRCMHCVNPPCVKLCPWGAAKQFPNGVSRIDPDLCLGGSKCQQVCPWDIPQRQTGTGLYLDILPSLAGNGVMYKCDRCYDRLADGALPACIVACPEDVQTIGPREEIIRLAHDIARDTNGHIYGEAENGGTHTIYVSPVPFDTLDATVEKGPGLPHLGPVPDTMADANHIAAAMVIAPIAGALAAAGKWIRRSGRKAEKEDNR